MRRGSAEDRGPRAEGCQLWPLWVLLGFWVLLALVLPWDECSGAPVNLAWDPVQDARVTGYELGWGAASGDYAARQSTPAATTATLDLPEPGPWHIAVRALGSDGGEAIASAWSNEVVWQAEPSGPTQPLGQVGLWARYERGAPMALAVVQSQVAAGTSIAMPSNVTAGNLLVLFALAHNATPLPSSPSGGGFTYTSRASGGATWMPGVVWTAPISSSGALTITVTGSNTLYAVEVSGHDGTTPVDGTGVLSSWGSAAAISALPNTTVADALVLAMAGNFNSQASATPSAGYSTLQSRLSNSPSSALVSRLAGAAGNYDPTITFTGNGDLTGLAISLIPSTGAAATSLLPPSPYQGMAHLLAR